MNIALDIFALSCAFVVALWCAMSLMQWATLRRRARRVRALTSAMGNMSDELIAHTIETLGSERIDGQSVFELEAFALELLSVRPVEGASILALISELRIYRGATLPETNRQDEPRKGSQTPPGHDEAEDRAEKIMRAGRERRDREHRHVAGEMRHNPPMNGRPTP